MALNKLLLIGGTTLAIGIASVAGAGVVSAQSGTTTGSTSIVDKIAQKFNLKSTDVQKVFDEDRTAHQAEHKAEMKTKLDQAVKDGKITADQEAKLIAKLDEMQANRPDFKTMTEAERATAKTAMDTKHADFEAWLTANNIPTDLVPHGGISGGPRGGHGMDSAMTSTANN